MPVWKQDHETAILQGFQQHVTLLKKTARLTVLQWHVEVKVCSILLINYIAQR